MTDIERIGLFDRDLKKLRKSYPSIDNDLDVFVKALIVNIPDKLPDTHRIPLGEAYSSSQVYKVRSFRCRSIPHGSRSGIRVIYAYDLKMDFITLLEIYHKSDRENHDIGRIIEFLEK